MWSRGSLIRLVTEFDAVDEMPAIRSDLSAATHTALLDVGCREWSDGDFVVFLQDVGKMAEVEAFIAVDLHGVVVQGPGRRFQRYGAVDVGQEGGDCALVALVLLLRGPDAIDVRKPIPLDIEVNPHRGDWRCYDRRKKCLFYTYVWRVSISVIESRLRRSLLLPPLSFATKKVTPMLQFSDACFPGEIDNSRCKERVCEVKSN